MPTKGVDLLQISLLQSGPTEIITLQIVTDSIVLCGWGVLTKQRTGVQALCLSGGLSRTLEKLHHSGALAHLVQTQ